MSVNFNGVYSWIFKIICLHTRDILHCCSSVSYWTWPGLEWNHLTQGHWGVSIPNPKPWIEGLSECGVECVQVGQCVRGDSVEGQSAGWPVQIHSYSVGAGGGDVYDSEIVIMPGSITVVIAEQTPGPVIVSKPTVITQSSPSDSIICHSYNSTSPTHLYLPVTAPSQTLSTQHLWPDLKSLWVIRVRLFLCPTCHLSVLLRQREESVCCVWVQCEITGIWWMKPDTIL